MVRAHGLKEGESRLLLESAQICIEGVPLLPFFGVRNRLVSVKST